MNDESGRRVIKLPFVGRSGDRRISRLQWQTVPACKDYGKDKKL